MPKSLRYFLFLNLNTQSSSKRTHRLSNGKLRQWLILRIKAGAEKQGFEHRQHPHTLSVPENYKPPLPTCLGKLSLTAIIKASVQPDRYSVNLLRLRLSCSCQGSNLENTSENKAAISLLWRSRTSILFRVFFVGLCSLKIKGGKNNVHLAAVKLTALVPLS